MLEVSTKSPNNNILMPVRVIKMAGIIGIFGKHGNDHDLLDVMKERLVRSPHHKVERYHGKDFGLARIHLGKYQKKEQPIVDPEHRALVMVHGRIYRDEGSDIDISDDADYCLAKYLKCGIDFIKGLDGNFLLVIHDLRTNSTYVVNDRFGFRPHYYALKDGSMFMAPEPKAILSALGESTITDEAVVEFFARGKFWGGRTWFKDLHILAPATVLMFNEEGLKSWSYWDMKYQADRTTSDEAVIEKLIETFKKAVSTRLTPGLRIGTSLSGGMDSRTVIAGMDIDNRRAVTSLTFGSEECGEVVAAREVVRVAGIGKHEIMEVTPKMIIDNAAKDVELTECRLFMGLAFTHPIFEKFGEEVDVLMDGFALDLTLGGSYLSDEVIKGASIQRMKEMARGKRLFSDVELAELLLDKQLDKRIEWLNSTVDEAFSNLVSEEPANIWDEFSMKTHVAWMHIGDVPLLEHVEVTHPSSDSRFFDILLQIPPEKRIHHRIYRSFLMTLDMDLANVVYNNTGCKVSAPLALWSIKYKFRGLMTAVKLRLNQISNGGIDIPLRKSYVNYDAWFRSNSEWRCFLEGILLDRTDGSDQYLNHNYIKRMLDEEFRGHANAVKLLHIASFKMFLRSTQRRS